MSNEFEAMKAELAKLRSENERLKKNQNGPKLAWAKTSDGGEKVGEALSLTFPGKRSRYLEVTEFEWIMENGLQALEDLINAS